MNDISTGWERQKKQNKTGHFVEDGVGQSHGMYVKMYVSSKLRCHQLMARYIIILCSKTEMLPKLLIIVHELWNIKSNKHPNMTDISLFKNEEKKEEKGQEKKEKKKEEEKGKKKKMTILWLTQNQSF